MDFCGLKQENFEKYTAHMLESPQISFLPDKSKLGSSNRCNMKLRTERDSDAKEARYTFNFDTFGEGTIEERIRVLDAFDRIKEQMPLTTVASKFDFFSYHVIRTGTHKVGNNSQRKMARKLKKTKSDGSTETITLGKSEGTFAEAFSVWKYKFFHKDSLIQMRDYLKNGLIYPAYSDVTVTEWVN